MATWERFALKQRQLTGHFMAIFCVIVWGSTFVVSKSLLAHLQPLQLMLIRFIIAYAAMWLVYPKWHFRLKEEWRFLVMGFLANTLYAWAENTALTITFATNVSILVSTTPIMTAILMALFHRSERLNRLQLIGFAVAFAGMVLVVFNGTVALQLKPTGDLLSLLAAATWAVYGLLLRRWSKEYNSALITRKLMFYGVLTVLPMVLSGNTSFDFSSILTLKNGLQLAYLGIVGSAICFLFWNIAIRQIGVLTTTLYIYSIPLVTLVISAIFLHEKITFMGVLGIFLVIAGMLLGTIQLRGKKPVETSTSNSV